MGGNLGSFGTATSNTTTFTPNFPQNECSSTPFKIDVMYMIANAAGCTSSRVVTLSFSRSYPLSAIAQPASVCGTGTILKGSCFGTGSATWTLISKPGGAPDPTITSPSSATTTVTGLVQGGYVFRYTVTGGCNPGSVDVSLNVASTSGVSRAAGGNDQFFCSIPSLVSLSGNAAGVGETVTWMQLNGGTTGTINTPNSANTTVSGLTTAGAPYNFLYMISSAAGCTSIDTVTLNVEPALTITPGSLAICTAGGAGSTTNNPLKFGNFQFNQLDTVKVSVTYLSGPAATVSTSLGGGSNFSAAVVSNNIISTALGQTISQRFWNTGISNSPNELYLNRPSTGSFSSATYFLSTIFGVTTVGAYKFKVVYETKCNTYATDVTIDRGFLVSSVNAGTDVAIGCGNSTAALAGNLNDGFGIWNTVSLPGGAVDPINLSNQTLRNPALSGLINGTYVFRYANNSASGCTQVFDDVKIVVSNAVPPTPNAGIDQTTCAGTINLAGTAVPSTALAQWTVISPAGAAITFSDPSSANPVVYGLLPNTTYVFRYTLTNGCGSTFDEITVNTNASSTPDKPTLTSPTSSDCSYTPIGSFPTSSSITFTVPALTGTQVGTVSVITDPVDALTSFTVTSPTATTRRVDFTLNKEAMISYVYCVNDPANCAPITVCDTISRAFYLTTNTVNAGPDQQICSVTSYPFTATLTGSTRQMTTKWTMIYSSNGLPATINSPATEVTTVSIPANGTYRFKYEVVGNDKLCALNFDNDIVEITTSSPGDIALAGNDITFCNATGVTALGASALANGTGQWQIARVISGALPVINTPASATSNITFSQSGSVELIWSAFGSNSSCGASSSDKVIVTYYAPAQAGNDQTFCSNTSTILNALNPAPTTGSWSQISGPNTASISDATNFQTVVSGLIPGTYSFRWSVNAPACATTDDVVVTISGNPQTAAAGPDANTCSGGTGVIQLNATPAPVGYTGTWALVSFPAGASAGAFQDVNLANSKYNGITVQGSYVFSWTVSNGVCSTTDFITVTGTATPCSLILPITLGSFYAQSNNANCSVQLNWESLTEVNVAAFNVERSTDGVNFTTIKVLAATGNSTQAVKYSWNDNTATAGAYYYRLRMVDRDGTYKYSGVISVRLNCNKSVTMQLLPNALAKGQIVKVRVTMTEPMYKGTMNVTNAIGQQLSVYPVVLHQGITTIDYPYSNLPSGSYILSLKDDKGKITESARFIVQ